MSTWTAPVTWAAAAVTAASMNTEIRDHLNFLKGALDLITNSTTADTGDSTYLRIVRAATSDFACAAAVSGDTAHRFQITANGQHEWGPGNAAIDTTLYRAMSGYLQTDDTFRSQRTVSTDHAFAAFIAGDTNHRWNVLASGKHEWGPGNTAADTILERDVSTSLKLTGRFGIERATGNGAALQARVAADSDEGRFVIRADGKHEWGNGTATDTVLYRSAANVLATDDAFDFSEVGAPAAPAANTARLFAEDNGAGKTRLVVRFPTGANVVLATEP